LLNLRVWKALAKRDPRSFYISSAKITVDSFDFPAVVRSDIIETESLIGMVWACPFGIQTVYKKDDFATALSTQGIDGVNGCLPEFVG